MLTIISQVLAIIAGWLGFKTAQAKGEKEKREVAEHVVDNLEKQAVAAAGAANPSNLSERLRDDKDW